jgi:hypothetical protein
MQADRVFAVPRKFLTPEDLAAYLRVRVRWIYEHARCTCSDPIPHLKLGKYIRFNPESPEFQAWLQRHSITGIDNHE